MTQRLVELTNRIAQLSGGRRSPAGPIVSEAGRGQRPFRARSRVRPARLSRQEFADMTGTTIETCIRVMSRWGKDEVVPTEKDGFLVLDPEALESAAAS
jgi:CRP-like cAMP-binding protein